MRGLIKTIFYTILLSVLFIQALCAQDSSKGGSVNANISIGYLGASLHDPSLWFDNLFNSVKDQDIPIKKENEFGNTLSLGLGLLYSNDEAFNNMKLGVIFGYMYSPARAHYSGSFGAINIKGTVESFQLFFIYHKIFLKTGDFNFYYRFKPGIAFANMNITEDVEYVESSEFNVHYKMSSSGSGFIGDITGGFSYQFSLIQCFIEAGYRFSMVYTGGKEEPVTPENEGFSPAFDIAQSGFIIMLSAGIEL